MLIFLNMLLSAERQTVEAWGGSGKQRSFGNRGATEKYLSLSLPRVNLLKPSGNFTYGQV
jgi:hypothetical protein